MEKAGNLLAKDRNIGYLFDIKTKDDANLFLIERRRISKEKLSEAKFIFEMFMLNTADIEEYKKSRRLNEAVLIAVNQIGTYNRLENKISFVRLELEDIKKEINKIMNAVLQLTNSIKIKELEEITIRLNYELDTAIEMYELLEEGIHGIRREWYDVFGVYDINGSARGMLSNTITFQQKSN